MKLSLNRSTALLPAFSRISLAIGLAGMLAFSGPSMAAAQQHKQVPYAAALAPGAPVSFADLIEEISPAVVSINVETHEEAPDAQLPEGMDQLPEQFREFFRRQQPGRNGKPRAREGRALGSGFLISREGYVVTNNHVIENASKITVAMQDGREFEAEMIGKDKLTDLAVLKIKDDKDFPFVSFAEDINLRVGDWVVAVGNPFGLGGTATAGIVSATGREIGRGAYDFIQIDASINRGNSGGPAFDLYGNVVGVNSQILSPTGGNIGIGFAIPARVASKVTKELIDKGSVTRGYLGVNIQSIDQDLADSEGLKAREGALVAKVIKDSPAKKAGFKTGDIVLKLDGKSIEDSRDLTRKVGELFVGHKAKFLVLRNGKRKTLTVTIGKRPDNLGETGTPEATTSNVDEFGMELGSLSQEDRDRLDLEEDRGILVERVEAGKTAFKKGIRAGNALLAAGSTDLNSPADFERAVNEARKAGRKAIRILVQNRNGQLFTALRLDETKSKKD
ncbi:MAG: protease Do [Robiginitomaculum sp.]|nr:MAG: protease Do [Robiginitomaculum sp.]